MKKSVITLAIAGALATLPALAMADEDKYFKEIVFFDDAHLDSGNTNITVTLTSPTSIIITLNSVTYADPQAVNLAASIYVKDKVQSDFFAESLDLA